MFPNNRLLKWPTLWVGHYSTAGGRGGFTLAYAPFLLLLGLAGELYHLLHFLKQLVLALDQLWNLLDPVFRAGAIQVAGHAVYRGRNFAGLKGYFNDFGGV